jgi:hypothetical protein
MGNSSATPADWDFHTTKATAGTTRGSAAAFKSTGLKDSLDPSKVVLRESRDSPANPNSTAIFINLDVTGSMNGISDYMIRDGLPTLFKELYSRKPVTDPHIMFGGVGDVAAGDRVPLQVSQYEADVVLVDQLTNIYLENGGGGNNSESYTLPWYFAALKTSIDCFEKRGKKGYLFTIGDDGPPAILRAEELKRVFGPGEYQDMTSEQLFDLVSRQYNVYHILVERGGSHREDHVNRWVKLIGEHAIRLPDYTKLSETIVSILQVNEGADIDVVVKSWSGDTSLVVKTALGSLAKTSTVDASKEVTVF